MTHEDYKEMQKTFKIASWCFAGFFTVATIMAILFSCTSTKNICKKPMYLSGEVIYAIPAERCTRTVTLKTDSGIVKIYRVPIEQPLDKIPVCTVHGNYYWVMP